MDSSEEGHPIDAWPELSERDRRDLQTGGITSLEDLVRADPVELAKSTELSEAWIRSLRADARDYLTEHGVPRHRWTDSASGAEEAQTSSRGGGQAPPSTRDSAWPKSSLGKGVAVMLINLAVPGLGSILGGYLVRGLAQLALLIAGGILTVTLIGALAGVPLLALAWVWAVWTGGKNLDQAIEEFSRSR